MSYRRSFNKRIAIRYSGTVNYPASQSGGSISYSGTEYEDVHVNIDVETDPFDSSVSHCNNTVKFLTGAVVTAETAQIASIAENARKVGGTIVEGFFKTIRSEISQQISELSSRLEATLKHLHEMAKRCSGMQLQMESDYNKLAERYMKTFNDLDNELSNRIFELDKPAFTFRKQSDNHALRASGNDMVGTVAVSGAEGSNLQAKIGVSVAKKRALDTIGTANGFLTKQKTSNATINQSMLNESVETIRYSPVCFIETRNAKSRIDRNVYQTDFLPAMSSNGLADDFQSKKWVKIADDDAENIRRYFNGEVSGAYAYGDAHAQRVRETMTKLLNIKQILMIND